MIIRKGRRGSGLGGVRIGEQGGIGGGEEALEEEGGGDLIDDVFAVKTSGAADGTWSVAGGVEESMGVVGGEALVKEMMGEGRMGFLQCLCESLGLGGLRAGCAVGVKRVADEKNLDLVLADEAGDGFEVGAQSCAVEGEKRLSGETEGVGDSEADAAVAYVECEGARVRHRVSVRRERDSRQSCVDRGDFE